MKRKRDTGILVGLAALLVLIAVLAVSLRLRDNAKTGVTAALDSDFAFPSDEIFAVRLVKGRNEVISLERTSRGWVVNGNYLARMSSVDPLLEAMSLMRIKYIPSEKAVPNIHWEIAAHGIGVEVFDRDRQLVRKYMVGGATYNEMGTHVMMYGSSQPYVMSLPTMDGSFRTRFALSEEDWRDRHFITMEPSEMIAVEVDYPRQKSQSFRIVRKGFRLEVEALHPGLQKSRRTLRQGAAEAYLRALSQLACESYKNAYPGIDSVRSLTPFSTVKVTSSRAEYSFALSIYPNGIPVYSEFTGPVHRLFIDKEPGDFMGAQYQVIKGILRGYDHFFSGTETELIF